MEPLVTTQWLAGELGRPDLVVFDATKYLPNENKDGRAEFLRAHIPGAPLLRHRRGGRPGHRPAAHGSHPRPLRQAAGRASASATPRRVVFYDQKGLASAARGWWLMGLFGHDNAAVLDGGLPKWLREGRPTEAGEPPAPAPATFRPDYRATRLRGVGDVLRNVQTAGGTGAGRPRRRPLHRRDPGAARRHAQRPHPRLRQPALHRPAEPGRHVPRRGRPARPLRRRRRGRRRAPW